MKPVQKIVNANIRIASRNYFFGFFSIVAQLVGTTLSFFVIARIPGLSVADFGVITYSFALSQLFSIFFEYGIGQYLAKETAGGSERDIDFEKSAYGLHIIFQIIGFAAFTITLHFLELTETAFNVCIWIGGSVFLTSTTRFLYAYYQGQEKMHLELLGAFIETSIIIIVVSMAFIYAYDVITIGKFFFYGRLVAWITAYAMFVVKGYWITPIFNWLTWRRILTESLPFGLALVVAFAITNIDTIMLQHVAASDAEHQVGLYQSAIRLIFLPTILGMAATKVFLPQLSRMGKENPASVMVTLRHLNNLLQSSGMIIGVFFVFFADDLVRIVYGAQFIEAAIIVKILGITMILRFGAAYNIYFALCGKMWLRVGFAVVALVSTIFFNFILIPMYGVIGVAYASVITHIIYFMPFLIAMHVFEHDAFLGFQWKKAFMISLLFGALLYLTSDWGLVLRFVFSFVFMLLATYHFMQPPIRRQFIKIVFGKL